MKNCSSLPVILYNREIGYPNIFTNDYIYCTTHNKKQRTEIIQFKNQCDNNYFKFYNAIRLCTDYFCQYWKNNKCSI